MIQRTIRKGNHWFSRDQTIDFYENYFYTDMKYWSNKSHINILPFTYIFITRALKFYY